MKTKCFIAKNPRGDLIPYYTASYAKQVKEKLSLNVAMSWEEMRRLGWRIVKCEIIATK